SNVAQVEETARGNALSAKFTAVPNAKGRLESRPSIAASASDAQSMAAGVIFDAAGKPVLSARNLSTLGQVWLTDSGPIPGLLQNWTFQLPPDPRSLAPVMPTSAAIAGARWFSTTP